MITDQFPILTYDYINKPLDEKLTLLSNKISDELNKTGKTNCKYEMFLDFARLRLRQDRINYYIVNLCIAYIHGTFKQKQLIRAGIFQYWKKQELYKLYND